MSHDPNAGISRAKLEHDLRTARTLFDRLATLACAVLSLIAAFPLFGVLWMLISRGATHFRLDMLTSLPPSGLDTEGGGFGNAILGTAYMVLIAGGIAIPTGIMAAIYLAEFGRNGKFASAVRFATRVLTGMPSILAGIFAFALVVLTTGSFSAYAGGIALSVLMLPIVVLTAEEAVRAVPRKMKEAAIGMGATSAQVAWRVTLPTAMPSILTGVMLAVARAAGETAPLLFTAQFSYYWLRFAPFPPIAQAEDTASLSALIYEFSGSPYDHQIQIAWSASLVLVAMVLAFNIVGQILASRNDLARR